MSVRIDGDVIRLEGACHVEQAEVLLQALLAVPERTVDVAGCRHLHGAVVQVLLSFATRVSGDPADAFLRQFVAPNFQPPGR
jgi:hypothetical protein